MPAGLGHCDHLVHFKGSKSESPSLGFGEKKHCPALNLKSCLSTGRKRMKEKLKQCNSFLIRPLPRSDVPHNRTRVQISLVPKSRKVWEAIQAAKKPSLLRNQPVPNQSDKESKKSRREKGERKSPFPP